MVGSEFHACTFYFHQQQHLHMAAFSASTVFSFNYWPSDGSVFLPALSICFFFFVDFVCFLYTVSFDTDTPTLSKVDAAPGGEEGGGGGST